MPLRALLIWQMLISLPLFAVGGWLGEDIAWENLGWQPIVGILYQGVSIAGLGFMVTSYLMKNFRPSIMLSFNSIAPVSGVLLSIWLLDEPMTWHLIVGVLSADGCRRTVDDHALVWLNGVKK